MNMRTAWESVVESLRVECVDFLFGHPGGGDNLFDLLDSAGQSKPKAILCRAEESSSFFAASYAKLSGKPGVCWAPPGPGVSKLVPGILEARDACAPVIVIAGASSQKHAGMGALQEVDQISMMRPVTKWAERVTLPERVSWVMRRAFYKCRSGTPGPVFVEIPLDVCNTLTEIPQYEALNFDVPVMIASPENVVASAVELLLKSKRPLLVSGGGARNSKAHEPIRILAERFSIPVMTTPSGRGIIEEDHPLSFGQVGLYATKLGMELYQDSDLLITVGSRNEDLQSGLRQYFPENAKYIQIDINEDEIARNWVPDVALVGDAAVVMRSILNVLTHKVEKEKASIAIDRKRIEDYKARRMQVYQAIERKCLDDNSVPLRPKRVIKEVNRAFNRNTILCNENGSQDTLSYSPPYYSVLDMDGNLAPGEQTCFGWGVLGAIGAKLAEPDKKVVCITGDAAFQHSMKELSTAVQYDAPVTYVILNNSCHGTRKLANVLLRGRDPNPLMDFKAQPDFVKIAEAYDCYGKRVEVPADIEPALKEALEANSRGIPAVLDMVTSNAVADWEVTYGRYLLSKIRSGVEMQCEVLD